MMNGKKTKIVCTIGPACSTEAIMTEMVKAGMDVARINFSHQTHEEHLERINILKVVREKLGVYLAILGDTKGPEVRLLKLVDGKATLVEGQSFTLTTDEIVGNDQRVGVTHKGLPGDVKPGVHILIDDGLIDLVVEAVQGTEIQCRVLEGGIIKNQKGVNVPDARLSLPYMSAKDRTDLRFAVEQGFDFIATSFTRSARDVTEIRNELDRLGGRKMRIIAKIENGEGVANIMEILNVADGIMVARGDMGVEIALEEIPAIQKRLIRACVASGKPVITATQMLESMTHHARPTRAETTDVANAVYDGTSALMLSGETAAGEFPVEAVKTMVRIARRTEREIDYKQNFTHYRLPEEQLNITNAVSHATCSAAHDLNAACIVTVTESGETARMVSRFRPLTPILGVSPSEMGRRQMNLSWGVTPVAIEEQTLSADILIAHSIQAILDAGFVENGDLIILTAGVPLGVPGQTNMLKIHVVGDPT